MNPRDKATTFQYDKDELSDSSSSEIQFCNEISGAELQEQQTLFEDPAWKRQRFMKKDDHIYGIFNDEYDENRENYPSGVKERLSYLKDTEFVSMDEESDSQTSKNEEDQKESSDRGGLGYSSTLNSIPRRGLGFSSSEAAPRGGLGLTSSTAEATVTAMDMQVNQNSTGTPLAFGSSRQKNKFKPSSRSNQKQSLPKSSIGGFEQYTKGFGAKMLAKMGYVAGQGLGASGQGIVNPIEATLRSSKAGLGAVKEISDKARVEAIRTGRLKVASDEEIDITSDKKKLKARTDGWKKSSGMRRAKKEYKTADEIMMEASTSASQPTVPVPIIDMTGKEARQVHSVAAALMSPTPDGPSFLPELRHNLSLIIDLTQAELEHQARESKTIKDRETYISKEREKLSMQIARLTQEIHLNEEICTLVKELEIFSLNIISNEQPDFVRLDEIISKLIPFSHFTEEYKLDELVVGAMAPVLKRILVDWKPFEEPRIFIQQLMSWKSLLRIDPKRQEDYMSPYASFIWNVWLPHVRSSFNNDWDVEDAAPAVKFIETWMPYLPRFVWDNIVDQLILPKLERAVEEWKPSRKKSQSLPAHAWIFPWLSAIETIRMSSIFDLVKTKLKSALRKWQISDGVLEDLEAWKEVLDQKDIDAMVTTSVLEKMGASLREDFDVNPRQQDMTIMDAVLAWRKLFRESTFSMLFELSFFPKWLDVMHMWLTHPQAEISEVAEWYRFWHDYFPNEILNLPAFTRGFAQGMNMMNQARALGVEGRYKLAHPAMQQFEFDKRKNSDREVVNESRQAENIKPLTESALNSHQPTSFRELLEEFLSSENLLLMPTQRAHVTSGRPLFKVAESADIPGVTCYIEDNIVWVHEGEEYIPVSVDELANLAHKRKRKV